MVTLDPLIMAFIGDLPFDYKDVSARYAEQRDVRLLDSGRQAYVPGANTRLFTSSAADAPTPRAGLNDLVDVTIIGGGFAGLVAGARLKEAGYDAIRIVEGGADFGGTWYWNRYPGVQCDIESYCYMPLLEETNYIPTQRYASGQEIYEHCQRIATRYGLYENALLQTSVERAEWDDARGTWTVETNRGDRFESRFVFTGTGAAHRIKLPALPGIESFEGHAFHTNRWDYGYTGGDSSGGLAGLLDKRVAIIGTGATAIQAIPHLAEWSKELFVFQRTPSSVNTRNNAPTDPEWAASLRPGWQRERQNNFNTLVSGGFQPIDLVSDGWTEINRRMFGPEMLALREALGRDLTIEEFAAIAELLDMQLMDRIRRRIEDTVENPETAAALKPWYRLFCKRPCFHDGYLDAFNRPNVTLVDTGGVGVEAVSPKGVIAGGNEYPVDCIIYATGFEIGSEYRRGPGKNIVGRGGIDLDQHWADGLQTLHGVMSNDFPNMFYLGFTQGAFTPSFPHTLEHQVEHIIAIMKAACERGADVIEADEAAVATFVREIRESAGAMDRFYLECTPGYYNGEGDLKKGAFYEVHRGGAISFFTGLKDWRKAGEFAGVKFSHCTSSMKEKSR